MLTISKRIPAGRGLAPALVRRAAAVVLDSDTRQKSRFDTDESTGRRLGVFLPRGTAVRGGDVLATEDGSEDRNFRRCFSALRLGCVRSRQRPAQAVQKSLRRFIGEGLAVRRYRSERTFSRWPVPRSASAHL